MEEFKRSVPVVFPYSKNKRQDTVNRFEYPKNMEGESEKIEEPETV